MQRFLWRNGLMNSKLFFKASALSAPLLAVAAFLVACSTITPYTLDLAEESQRFGTLSPAEAVDIVKTKTRISGEVADYRSFLVDEEGFSYTKTSKKTRTDWKKGKAIRKNVTHTETRHVPWKAVAEIEPYYEEYKVRLFGSAYRVRLRFSVTTVRYSQRVKEQETFAMSCKTREDLADVMAALRKLTDK